MDGGPPAPAGAPRGHRPLPIRRTRSHPFGAQPFAWRDLEAPYEVARTSVLIARACRALGDEEGARLELQDARETFARLGARTDVALADMLLTGTTDSQGLTPRELEVLKLVVAGLTNRRIATQLFLSERTVHRHISNIFDKLGVGSRTEAAAYAFQHQLVR